MPSDCGVVGLSGPCLPIPGFKIETGAEVFMNGLTARAAGIVMSSMGTFGGGSAALGVFGDFPELKV